MLDEGVRRLARAANFAVVTTLGSGGQPASHVMWVDCDDEHLLLNSEVHRPQHRNVLEDTRVAVVIVDGSDFYSYAEIRGHVVDTTTGAAAREHIDRLSEKYTGSPYAPGAIVSERVVLAVRPDSQRVPQVIDTSAWGDG